MPSAPRIHNTTPLHVGLAFALSPQATRHVQVLRLQPGDAITLFGSPGQPGEYAATVSAMGRRDVQVRVVGHDPVEREARQVVHLAVGVPANERMDWLVEKATELGVASVQPLFTARTVVSLGADRALKRVAHWNSIAVAACEQCGRNRVPVIHPPETLASWSAMRAPAVEAHVRLILSLRPGTVGLRALVHGGAFPASSVTVLLGPEGGLSAKEEAQAMAQGFAPVSLGEPVLRAETAALAALTLLG